jgi:ATP-binding cassette subfamily F protein uup
MKNPNFLILDEPTNDLDLDSLAVLEDFLENYKGCVIIVTHDRYFMDRLVDHLFIFEGSGVIDGFTGNYTDYRLEKMLKEKQLEQAAKVQQVAAPIKTVEVETKVKPKISYKEKLEYETLEKEIATTEAKKTELENKLNTATSDHAEMTKISEQIATLIFDLDKKTMRWLELSEKMD